jgi:hypothetical protein
MLAALLHPTLTHAHTINTPRTPRPPYVTQDGASPGVHYFMEILARQPSSDAFLVPIPQVRGEEMSHSSKAR